MTNYPYLVALANTHKPVIMSTGMCSMEEIRAAVEVLKGNGCGDIKLLQCNTEYPTPFEDVNLNAMESMRRELGLEVGYSDHTKGIEIPIAAVAMGATVIEKHFTLDRKMEGPDHKASLEPDELRNMVESIRHVEEAFGSGVKEPSLSEKKNIAIVRKSIVTSKEIKRGELFSESNLTTKRPGNGLSPMKWNEIIGTVAERDYATNELV